LPIIPRPLLNSTPSNIIAEALSACELTSSALEGEELIWSLGLPRTDITLFLRERPTLTTPGSATYLFKMLQIFNVGRAGHVLEVDATDDPPESKKQMS
jgi:hypothetical protein